MTISRRGLVAGAASIPLLGHSARAQAANTLKIGVMTDLSGPYQDLAGPLAVACANLAGEDFGVAGKGFRVEVVQADHQNKADIGAGVARRGHRCPTRVGRRGAPDGCRHHQHPGGALEGVREGGRLGEVTGPDPDAESVLRQVMKTVLALA